LALWTEQGFEDETLGVHQQVSLSAFDLLATVEAALSCPPPPVVFTDWESTT
jgi:hypothetical protein